MEESKCPIFQKGNKDAPGNYRPVKLTSSPGKVVVQIILETISNTQRTRKEFGMVSMDLQRGNHD